MKNYSDEQILNGIIKHDSRIINFVYQSYYPMIERMISNLGGDSSQAKDVFQEAIIIIYRKVTAEELSLCCKFSTYLYSICKKIFIQELKSPANAKNARINLPDIVCEPESGAGLDMLVYEIFEKHFNELSESCQKILRLHFNRASIEDIRSIMGYNNAHHVMDRKYRCKRSLIKRILNDPKFKEIKNELIRENRSLS